MKLRTRICKKNSNASEKNSTENTTYPLSCVDWSSNEEVYYVSDDHQIFKWSEVNRDSVEVAKLPDDFVPTDLHWLLLGGRSSGGGKGSDSLLICSNDGRFVILNKSARVERSISAHTAAISSGRWSPDAAGLLTAGEDGVIKIWSRSGMLRSTIVQNEEAIRCARWAPNSTSILFCQGGHISIKPLAANSKLIRWRAHDGLVLSLSWSSQSNIIASGGEDFRYKIWDAQGANLFTSAAEYYAITSVAFNPEKDYLLVGTFNMLRLCHSNGWSYSSARFSEPRVGSFFNLSWSADGTQVACGSSMGELVLAYVIEQKLISKNLKAISKTRKSIVLKDIATGTQDILDFPQRVVNFALGYGHLVVATTHQVHIYNEKYINTPIIIDGRNDTRVIEVGKKYFMILDASSIWVYTFTGRLHLNPRYPGSQAQIPLLTWRSMSLGLDVLAIRDNSDPTSLHLFDLIPGASRQYDPHLVKAKQAITEIAACRAGTPEDQFVAFIDSNRELFVSGSRNLNGERTDEVYKIGTQLTSIMWASETNILVGVHDSCYSIWYCPGEGAADPTIIALTTITLDTAEFGKHISIDSFEDAVVTFRSAGALLPVNVNMYCEILHRALLEGQWQQALKICRVGQHASLWATLAAVATRKHQLQISEEAYSAALQIDKVSYLQHLKTLTPSSAEQMAENSLMLGRMLEAETILLHGKKIEQAVGLSLRMHNWRRALEISQKYKAEEPNLMPRVLKERSKYLKALQREEWDPLYLPFAIKEEADNISE
ncbi:intraflagellar transport protein 80 homolog [Drosophila eugracilis]|uniref:intraflagellar transport protein 80 homolog n=1 Tax=Drosophila eugracilis TaxID=29029 RepID=UPI001BD9AD10|nr:intraflagellar transport protein 80 homolog [Drosophila eugracilis]